MYEFLVYYGPRETSLWEDKRKEGWAGLRYPIQMGIGIMSRPLNQKYIAGISKQALEWLKERNYDWSKPKDNTHSTHSWTKRSEAFIRMLTDTDMKSWEYHLTSRKFGL